MMDQNLEFHKIKFPFTNFIMYILTIATMNCHGQSKLEIPKQLFIQNFILTNKIDILLCQETKIEEKLLTNATS